MRSYWPWWTGAVGLGLLPLVYWIVLRRPFGVSGLIGRLVSVGDELSVAKENAAAPTGEALDALLAAATLEEFGREAAEGPMAVAAPLPGRPLGPRLGILDAAAFVVAMGLGGLVARLWAGRTLVLGMGDSFTRSFGSGLPALSVLLAGGVLVGAGTSLAEGCSTGHGLTGSSRLQPGSLLATACFMGAAMCVSALLGWRVGL